MTSEFEMMLAAEHRLGLPLLFYPKLLQEKDDWSFIVKMHALFEGVLNQSIRHTLRFPEVCRRANPSGWERMTYPEKLNLALKLQILEPDYFNFLEVLGRLRNKAVHNLRFIALDLRSYSEKQIDSPDKRKWLNAMGAGWKDWQVATWINKWRQACGKGNVVIPDGFKDMHDMSLREFMVFLSPRAAIWFAGVWTLDLLSLWLHIRFVDGKPQLDKSLEPNLQDLLLDQQVLDFKRKIFPNSALSLSKFKRNGFAWN